MNDLTIWIDNINKTKIISAIPEKIIQLIIVDPKKNLETIFSLIGKNLGYAEQDILKKDFAYQLVTHPNFDPNLLDKFQDWGLKTKLFEGLISQPNPDAILIRKFAFSKDASITRKNRSYLCENVARWMKEQKFIDLDIINHFISQNDFVGESRIYIAELIVIGDLPLESKLKFIRILVTDNDSSVRATIAKSLLNESQLDPILTKLLDNLRRDTDAKVISEFLRYMKDQRQYDSKVLQTSLVSEDNTVLSLITEIICAQEEFDMDMVTVLFQKLSKLPDYRKSEINSLKAKIAKWIHTKGFPFSETLHTITLPLLQDPEITVRKPIAQWGVQLGKIPSEYIELMQKDADAEIRNWALLVESLTDTSELNIPTNIDEIENILMNKEEQIQESPISEIDEQTAEPKENESIPSEQEPHPQKRLKIFLSYSEVDKDFFRIPEIAANLEQEPEIEHVYYWGRDCSGGESIPTYMSEKVDISDVVLSISTESSMISKSVSAELDLALIVYKRIIPIYLDFQFVRKELRPKKGISFNPDDFDGFLDELYLNLTGNPRIVSK